MPIGEIEGVNVGQVFDDRRALFDAGVHRQLQAGIVGRVNEGAERIFLSGGNADDKDLGLDLRCSAGAT
ncbi:YDG/SRA domain-containing protein [Labrenzia sp. VG12]|uniref:YDG/SRA domain-containing protein n=1 Tax=Labrenzia sp. VG12 TaxID=2021862 RepID=UPI000B8C606E|nr:hypothetical protein CHH27_21325 [Labrenzia sp. VG12]